MAKTTIAIMYDFDKTLSTTDMQNYGFMSKLGITPKEFWQETSNLTDEFNMDKNLFYQTKLKHLFEIQLFYHIQPKNLL